MKRILSGIFSFLAIMCMVIVSSVYINAQEISNAGRVVINEAVTKCATDGTGAAEKLNQLKDNTAEFEAGVREVLNTYYSMEKTARGQLQNFSAKIDTTAATILANYVEAEAERDNKDNLTFETGVVLVSFAPGTAIDTIETIVKTEAVSYEMIDDGEFHINEDLPDYKKKRLEKLKDIKTDIIILAKISLEDTVERAIEKFKKYECVTSASSNAYLYADSEEDEIENPVYKNYNGFVYHTMQGKVWIANYTGTKKKVTVPSKIDGMTVTAVNSLAGAKKLETIIIPASVTVSLHVSDAPVLKKVVINKNNRKYKVKNNMVVDKKVTTLYSCPGGLTGVKIPSTIKKVYYKAFYKGDIKKITIPKNVTTIGEEAFSECTKLQKVTFNKKLKYVKSKAFYGCKSLKSITFPDSVKEMGSEVFKNCTKLTSFKPGKKMNVIERCFEGCKSLKEIRLPKSVEYVSGWMFYDCKTLKKIYVYNKECDIYFNKKGKEWNGIPKRVTIYGYKGSTAEKYAKKNGNKFVAL